MSRGPGKVQRAILHELRSGKWMQWWTLRERLYGTDVWTASERTSFNRALQNLSIVGLIEYDDDNDMRVRLTASGRAYQPTKRRP